MNSTATPNAEAARNARSRSEIASSSPRRRLVISRSPVGFSATIRSVAADATASAAPIFHSTGVREPRLPTTSSASAAKVTPSEPASASQWAPPPFSPCTWCVRKNTSAMPAAPACGSATPSSTIRRSAT